MNRHVELLAPAGTFESLRAAINAGADAVYLGGSAFGARAYANNFDEQELIKALDFAHIRGRSVYLTVNTLLKNEELENQLYGYLAPYYEAGLDAVIVQDWGVFDYIKRTFTQLPIHASTQMTVTGRYGARLLKDMGAQRIVPARELTLEDIEEIDKNVDIEIETFVHGALCYSYSGQCLLSSMIGQRSGNRGRCAQPCRMMYNGNYPLSLKDMCTLDILPQIINAGVDSLKIEGRMKSSEYVAGVVSIYRKYIDCILNGTDGKYKVSDTDKIALMDLYNRGGFTEGYYTCSKGKHMVALNRPNHQGTCALKVQSVNQGRAVCKALTELNAQDVLELDSDFNYTLKEGVAEGKETVLSLPYNYKLDKGQLIFRTRNKLLIDSLKEKYINDDIKIEADSVVTLIKGEPARMVIWHNDIYEEVIGCVVQKADRQPLTEDTVRSRIMRTNDTPFIINSLEIVMEPDTFIPVGQLNELRREALEVLEHSICSSYHRVHVQGDSSMSRNEKVKHYDYDGVDTGTEPKRHDGIQKPMRINVMIDRESNVNEILDVVLRNVSVDGVYIEESAFDDANSMQSAVDRIHNSGKKAYIALPYVVRSHTLHRLDNKLADTAVSADGWLVRNLESAAWMKQKNPDASVIHDAGLYVMNSRARRLYGEQFAPVYDTLPYELTEDELRGLGADNSELVVYGYIPVMLAENCVKRTYGKCDGVCSGIMLKGHKGREFRVASRCRDCYSVQYNSDALYLLDRGNSIQMLNPASIRLIFTTEDSTIIQNIIRDAQCVRSKEALKNTAKASGYTHGHFNRGII